MSWAEVKKVNSDMAEPLNYTNYIYDISSSGASSYVLDTNNSVIWDELSLNSCYLYGHRKIHSVVLDRLTEANIDALFDGSPKLGRQLNNFHNTTVYAQGDASDVLKVLTIDQYNALERKIREGYGRYVDKKLQGDSACAWIKEVYGVDLSPCTSVDTLIANTDAWSKALKSEPLMVALTSSKSAMGKIVASSSAVSLITDAIRYAGKNGEAIDVIADTAELAAGLAGDKTSMDFIAAEQNALVIVLMHPTFAEAALKSTVAMTSFAASQVAVKMICQFYADMQKSKDNISQANTHTNGLKTNVANIWQGETALSGLNALAKSETDMIAVIEKITKDAVMVNDFITKVMANATFCQQVASNAAIMKAIAADATCSNAMAASDTLMNAVLASTVAMNAICASKTAGAACIAKTSWAIIDKISAYVLSKSSNIDSWVGATRNLSLKSGEATSVRLVAVNHAMCSTDAKHAFVFMFENVLGDPVKFSESDSSSSGTSCTMGTYTHKVRSYMSTLYNSKCPTDLASIIEETTVDYVSSYSAYGSSYSTSQTYTQGTSTGNKFFAPSLAEIGRNTTWRSSQSGDGAPFTNGTLFNYFTVNNNDDAKRIRKIINGDAVGWWVRDGGTVSTHSLWSSTHRYYNYVTAQGGNTTTYTSDKTAGDTDPYYCCPCFAV